MGAFLACCPPPRNAAPTHLPAAVLTFHADVAFEPHERRWLQEAAERLNSQTRGLVLVSFVYDLSRDGERWPVGLREALLRGDSSSEFVQDWDVKHGGASLLGITHPSEDDDEATAVMLVVDRLRAHDAFVSVAMHEILHAAGLNHVDDEKALMAASDDSSPTCLHRADVVELCRLFGCNVERIGYCDRE